MNLTGFEAKMKKEYKNVARSKAGLQEALVRALNEGVPIEKISVSFLCERAGISRGTFYNHYEKVMDLIREIENYYLELVGAAFAEIGVGNRANRLAFFERVNRVIEDNHHVAVAVTKCMPYDFQNDIQAKFARVNVKGIAKCFFGDFPSKEEKNLLELVSLGIASLYCATIVGKSGLSTKEVAEASVKLLDCIDPHLKGES